MLTTHDIDIKDLCYKVFTNNVQEVEYILKKNPSLVNEKFSYDDFKSFIKYFSANTAYYGVKLLGITLGYLAASLAIPNTTRPIAIGLAYGIFKASDNSLLPHTFDNNGWTLLHYAALGNSLDVAKLLVSLGADTTITGCYQRTCFDVARLCGYEGFVQNVQSFIDGRTRDTLAINKKDEEYAMLLFMHQKTCKILEKTQDVCDEALSRLVEIETYKPGLVNLERLHECLSKLEAEKQESTNKNRLLT